MNLEQLSQDEEVTLSLAEGKIDDVAGLGKQHKENKKRDEEEADQLLEGLEVGNTPKFHDGFVSLTNHIREDTNNFGYLEAWDEKDGNGARILIEETSLGIGNTSIVLDVEIFNKEETKLEWKLKLNSTCYGMSYYYKSGDNDREKIEENTEIENNISSRVNELIGAYNQGLFERKVATGLID